MEQDHFYEPAKGHGLKHDPFNAIIGPRPIGWISSRGADGSVNLAPYSFFNAFCYHPPIIGFSSIGTKDTLRNVRETREFVWNLATRELGEVVGVHIAPHLIVDGVFDTFSAHILLRAGGATAYAEVLPETRLDRKRPG